MENDKTLLGRTRFLMGWAQEHMTQEEIAEGSGTTYTWYQKFVRGAIADPGVERVQRVHDFLELEFAKAKRRRKPAATKRRPPPDSSADLSA